MANGVEPRVRIADVAREAGVSKAAVSFAFNKPDRLSTETAARIQDVAARMGYRPHPVARMLSSGQTTTIGILSPQALGQVFANPFFALFAEGVASVTEEHGFALLFISPLHGSLARGARSRHGGRHPRGRPRRTSSRDERHPPGGGARGGRGRARLARATRGSSSTTRAVPGSPLSIWSRLGHRQFLVLGIEAALDDAGDSDDGVTGRRLSGYRSALAPAGVELSPEQVMRPAATIEGGESAFLRAWSRGQRPTGVLCMSDAAAAGVLGAARRLGIRVPEELSIVGFDDLPLTRFTDPPLTTVHQPVRQKGEEAATMLLEALRRPSSGDQDRQTDPGYSPGGPPLDRGTVWRSASGGGRSPLARPPRSRPTRRYRVPHHEEERSHHEKAINTGGHAGRSRHRRDDGPGGRPGPVAFTMWTKEGTDNGSYQFVQKLVSRLHGRTSERDHQPAADEGRRDLRKDFLIQSLAGARPLTCSGMSRTTSAPSPPPTSPAR